MLHDESLNETNAGRNVPRVGSRGGWLPRCAILGGAWIAVLAWLGAVAHAVPADNQPPTVPSGCAVSAVTATGFRFEWLASTDNTGVTGYEVSLDGCASTTTTELAKTFTNLSPSTRYSVSVRARDARGNWSGRSAPLSVTTRPDDIPPSTPVGLTASMAKLTSLVLGWSAATDNVKVTAYEVFRDGVCLGETSIRSRTVSGLKPGTSYTFAVRARDAAGNRSPLSEPLVTQTVADTTPPCTPRDLCAKSTATTRVMLKWSRAKDDTKVTGYEVSRDGVSLGVRPGAWRRVLDLAPLTTYSFRVRACDAGGNWSDWSAPCVVRTLADTKKPSAPTSLVASAVKSDRVTLGWAASTDNVGVTSYEIQVGGATVATTSERTFVISGLVPNTTYTFRVRARDAAGNVSALSSPLKVKTPTAEAPLATPPTNVVVSGVLSSGFTISWQPPLAGSVVAYEIFIDGASAGTTASTSFVVGGLAAGQSYQIAVRAQVAAGTWSDLSPAVVGTTRPTALLGGFEFEEGYSLGPLQGQVGWSVDGAANVVASPVFSGRQALSVPPATRASFATHELPDMGVGIVFFDLFVLPAAANGPDAGVLLETQCFAVSLTKDGDQGELQVLDGNGEGGGTWLETGIDVPLASDATADHWLRLTIRVDQAKGTWDLWLDGRLIATDLAVLNENPTRPDALVLVGQATLPTGFDDILVSAENPLSPDVDRDGLDDVWEAAHGLDPARDDRLDDHDGDGLSNLDEQRLGTDPSLADSDGDGLPDGWEVAHGLNPLAAADAALDDDGDGLSNLQEFIAGSNPVDFYNGRALVVSSPPVTGEIAYSYDPSGRLIEVRYPSGAKIALEHDGAGNLTSVAIGGLPPIVAWRSANALPADGNGTGADLAVLAGDGLPNLAKYAFGVDPRQSVRGDLPEVHRVLLGSRSYLALSYPRPSVAPADLTYVVELSTDGISWRTSSVVTEQAVAADGRVLVTVRDAVAVGDPSAARRIRVKIERKATL